MSEPEVEGPSLVVVLPESELRRSGRISACGLVFALPLSEVDGLAPRELAACFGWSRPELDALAAAGDHLSAVIFAGGADCGYATAEGLAATVKACVESLRATPAQELAVALTVSPSAAARLGLAALQGDLAARFGVKPALFGAGRIGFRGDPPKPGGFVVDEKCWRFAKHPFTADAPLSLEDFPEPPTVLRLPWGD